MDSSSSRLDNEGKFDDALIHQDDHKNDVGEKSEEPKDAMMFISDEELNDEEENVALPLMLKDDEKVEEPKKSMTFSSIEEVCLYYRTYAKQAGFGIAYRTSRKKNGKKSYARLICTRGAPERTRTCDVVKPTPATNKTRCGANICANLCEDGTWFLSNVELKHNHSLSPGKARFFRNNRKINDAVKRRLELNDRAGIRLSKNFNSLVVEREGFESLSFGERDCRNYINKARELRLGKGGAQALCDYFSRMQEQNGGFYFAMDMDNDSRLRNVFWADARSRAAYDFFGDVITFDTTYLTNRYDMPFAPFVGVNHHGQSILLGVGLISSEDTNTFVWLFKSWLRCMNGQAPRAIITEQDRAMKNAIAIVFPKTRHRYCMWHIMKKLSEKFGSHANFDGIKSAIHTCLYDSQTCEEYEENWKDLLEKYHLHDNAWLHGLYMEKTFWVPAYIKDTFWAGMNTTQRSESMNAFFDGYVHSQTTLKEFVDEYDSALRRMVENETRANFDSFNRTIPCISTLQLEKQFQAVYTNAKFKEVREQIVKVISCTNSHLKSEGAISTFKVIEDVTVGDHIIEKKFLVNLNEDELDVKCTCALFEIRGILCNHSISVLQTKKVTMLPPRYFLDRWRKDIKREYSKLKRSYNAVGDNPNVKIHDKLRNNFEELLSLTSKKVERCMDLMKRMNKLKELWRCESQSSHVKHRSSSTPTNEHENYSQLKTGMQTTEQILQHEKSAAGILCQLKTRHGTQASHLPLTKDVLGIVATLGKVDDDNLSRLFAEYLGVESMLAIVCKTYEGVKALETYDKEGCINTSSGLHGLGTSIGRALDGRFLVICLENLIPYAGGFVADDPQRRLDLIKPRLPNGECPPGFLGFAVNMINVDNTNLFFLTASGYGLRETLFYSLFSRLQVYRTRAEMLLALPCISDGALSLDGGMIRSTGVFSLGNREDVNVKFPKPLVTSTLPENNIEAEKQVMETKWKKEKVQEDI